jgi:beta-phosphoglucomutase
VRDQRLYAVLWDMDGVLVDSGELHRQAWRVFLSRKGKPVTYAIFRLGFGRPNQQVLPDFFGHDLPDAVIQQLSDEKEQCYRELVLQKGIPPVPGVLDWMSRFQEAGVRQALATSGCRTNAELIVDLTGAARYLQEIVTADEVEHGKPSPDLFERASALLGVPPCRCLVIEDSLHGVRAAGRAGMRCLALTTTHSKEELLDCDLVLSDMTCFSWHFWQRLLH